MADLAQRLEIFARKDEIKGETVMALSRWRVVAALRPKDSRASELVNKLSAKGQGQRDRHVKRGKEKKDRKNRWGAFREYLVALSHSPGDKNLLENLRPLALTPLSQSVVIQPDDTPESIAFRAYNDPNWAPLIKSLTMNPKSDGLLSGQILMLPSLDDVYQKAFPGMTPEKVPPRQRKEATVSPSRDKNIGKKLNTVVYPMKALKIGPRLPGSR